MKFKCFECRKVSENGVRIVEEVEDWGPHPGCQEFMSKPDGIHEVHRDVCVECVGKWESPMLVLGFIFPESKDVPSPGCEVD